MRKLVGIPFIAVVSSLTLVVSASGSSSRDALIRPGVGIGKVRLGMTSAQVRAALGRHDTAQIEQRAFGQRHVKLVWEGGGDPDNYRTVGLLGRTGFLRVVEITTTRRTERTSAGFGPGSSRREVLRRVAGIRCQTVSRRDGRWLRNEIVLARPAGVTGETAFVPGGWAGLGIDTTKTIQYVIVRRPDVEADVRSSAAPCRRLFPA